MRITQTSRAILLQLCECPVVRIRPRYSAAAALALLILGQLLAFEHESKARHVECAEHGELLEVSNSAGSRDDGCGNAHLIAVDGDGSATHQDCAIARLRRTNARTSIVSHLHVTATELVLVAAVAAAKRPRPVDIIALAPKTSPPV